VTRRNNDWESTGARAESIFIQIGADWTPGKKITVSTYYSLSAGRANVDSRPLGDPTIIDPGPDQFKLTGTNAATPYPETVNRTHELAFVLKYKLTNNFTPRLEYRYQQWDNRDYQTSVMTPYMGCVSPIPNGPPVTNSVPGCTTPILTTNTPNPVGVPSPFYPGFVVGDTSAARYLFLGVDQPSYPRPHDNSHARVSLFSTDLGFEWLWRKPRLVPGQQLWVSSSPLLLVLSSGTFVSLVPLRAQTAPMPPFTRAACRDPFETTIHCGCEGRSRLPRHGNFRYETPDHMARGE
jgi:hypothetical protein